MATTRTGYCGEHRNEEGGGLGESSFREVRRLLTLEFSAGLQGDIKMS